VVLALNRQYSDTITVAGAALDNEGVPDVAEPVNDTPKARAAVSVLLVLCHLQMVPIHVDAMFEAETEMIRAFQEWNWRVRDEHEEREDALYGLFTEEQELLQGLEPAAVVPKRGVDDSVFSAVLHTEGLWVDDTWLEKITHALVFHAMSIHGLASPDHPKFVELFVAWLRISEAPLERYDELLQSTMNLYGTVETMDVATYVALRVRAACFVLALIRARGAQHGCAAKHWAPKEHSALWECVVAWGGLCPDSTDMGSAGPGVSFPEGCTPDLVQGFFMEYEKTYNPMAPEPCVAIATKRQTIAMRLHSSTAAAEPARVAVAEEGVHTVPVSVEVGNQEPEAEAEAEAEEVEAEANTMGGLLMAEGVPHEGVVNGEGKESG